MLPETTIIVVSHNWDIIKHCETAFVLNAGAIVDSVRVADITDKDKFFRKIHDKR